MTRSAVLLVLSDPWLVRSVTSFQGGLSVALRVFWTTHDPRASATKRFTPKDIDRILQLIVDFGSTHELALLQTSRFFAKGGWRVPNLSRVARLAVEKRRPELLEWAVANDVPLGKPIVLWKAAVGNADVPMLDVLALYCPITRKNGELELSDAVKTPTFALLEWLSTNFPGFHLPFHWTCEVAVRGDVDALRLLLDRKIVNCLADPTFRDAYEASQFHVLEYLVSNHAERIPDEDVQALVVDSRPEIRAIVTKYPAFFASAYKPALLAALRAGDLDQLEDLFANGACEPISIDRAAEWQGLEGLTFLHDRDLATATTEAMDRAAEKARWDVLEFLHTNRSEGCTTRAADAAAKLGSFTSLKMLLDNRVEGCTTDAMDHAAANRSIEMLRLLHQHSKGGCTTKAMDVAASRGYLQVVQFLHEHRSEGCTTDALDGAVKGGFVETVRFLCEHRTEGCTVDGIKAALTKHRIEAIQVLYEKFPHLFGPQLLNDLLLHGAFDIFNNLRRTHPVDDVQLAERVITAAGRERELRTIAYILEHFDSPLLRQCAEDGAADYMGMESISWRQAVKILTRPSSDAAIKARPHLHPFLLDPRTPTWAIDAVLNPWQTEVNEYHRDQPPCRWAVRAVLHRDPSLFDVLRDIPPVTVEPYKQGKYRHHDDAFSFAGARAAAIRLGERCVLEWLLTNVDYPIEPTLLGEALYYHQYDMAEWLFANYPPACTEVDWTSKGYEAGELACREIGLRDGLLLDWLEQHEDVRRVVPFTRVVDFAARKNDFASLERLFGWYPELFTPRPALVQLADDEECRDAINFLLEIGWSADVFLDDC